MSNTGRIYLRWGKQRNRADDIAAALQCELITFDRSVKNRIWRQLQVPFLMFNTYRRLQEIQPGEIICQHTHPYVSIVCACYNARNSDCTLVLDCHNGPFVDPPWSGGFLKHINRALYNRADINLVHNQGIYHYVTETMKLSGRFRVLHDGLPKRKSPKKKNPASPSFVVPLSWSRDEPIGLLIRAIAKCPECIFHLTGKARMKASALPENARLTGYLNDDDFDQLLLNATGVITLSRRDHVLTRGSQEALAYGNPIIATDTPTAREYYRNAAVYVENEEEAIIEGCRVLVKNEEKLRLCVEQRRKELQDSWNRELLELESELNGLRNSNMISQ